MEVKQDETYLQAIDCVPPPYHGMLASLPEGHDIEEVRLRAGRPPTVKRLGGERETGLPPVSAELLRDILSRAARYSVHSYADSLRHGFLTLAGGHRLGVCGTAVMENGEVSGIRGISSLNLRVARQIEEAGSEIEPFENGKPCSMLLLAPPGLGKTTLLRELARRVSDSGLSVAVADERCEIAALSSGSSQFEVGACTDVIEGCGKKEAAMMLLKTMSPALLVVDEITAPEDVEAVALCAHCGVSVLASAHARDLEDLRKRALYRTLLKLGLFERAVVISLEDGRRKYQIETL